MYEWRKMTEAERQNALSERKGRKLPWHSPPHLEFTGFVTFIITAACFDHQFIIGKDSERIAGFEKDVLETCRKADSEIFAWCILPNHYHLLVRTNNIKHLRKEIGQLHGRTARFWNVQDQTPGRKIWFNFFDRQMKSNRHFWASLNYIHHNPVHHGYAPKWQDWPFSSATDYLEKVSPEKAAQIWREFPILDYGKDWDIY